MKNVHLLPTDKPSRLCINGKNQMHIYITSDEEIKEEDWFLDRLNQLWLTDKDILKIDIEIRNKWYKKIILTTDQDLIKDGVQAIDDEFLEWFVKNPSCEEVEVAKGKMKLNDDGQEYGFPDMSKYKIIIPQEEPKQETLEEVAESRYGTDMDSIRGSNVYDLNTDLKRGFIEGAKWQQKRMYSEEECYRFLHDLMTDIKLQGLIITDDIDLKKWFEQFKKK
jgi:hypothetical protein